MSDLYIFDKDGTLTDTFSGQVCPNTPQDQFLLPGVAEKLKNLQESNHIITVATNQGGVSCGYFTEQMWWKIFDTMNCSVLNSVQFCAVNFFHEKGRLKHYFLDKAKPKPTLLMEIVEQDVCVLANIEKIVVVGDSKTDFQAFQAFQTVVPKEFFWAHDFFGWDKCYVLTNDFGYRFDWKRFYAQSQQNSKLSKQNCCQVCGIDSPHNITMEVNGYSNTRICNSCYDDQVHKGINKEEEELSVKE